MSDDSDSITSTFKYKIPFFILGVVIGMLLVWIALQWVPAALQAALATIGAG